MISRGKFLRQWPWYLLQAAIVGIFLWVDYAAPGRSPEPGKTLVLGVVAAYIVTGLPFVVRDVVVGVWSTIRARLHRDPERPALMPDSLPANGSQLEGGTERLSATDRRSGEIAEGSRRIRIGE
jgi:hypothetical protein